MEYILLLDETLANKNLMHLLQVGERHPGKVMMIGMQGKVEVRQDQMAPPFTRDYGLRLFNTGFRKVVYMLAHRPPSDEYLGEG